MRSLDIDDVKAVRDILASLPPNYVKLSINNGLSARQAAAANTSKTSLSLKTNTNTTRCFAGC
jgi:hypothetical protein